MTHEQSLNTIEQALNLATQKGAFSMAEVQLILQALQTLKHEAGGDQLPANTQAQAPGAA